MGKDHNQNKKYQCECGIKYSRKPNYLAHWRKNCLLNKSRENRVLPANCPKAPKIDFSDSVLPSVGSSTQEASIFSAESVGATVVIETKPTSLEPSLNGSQESNGALLMEAEGNTHQSHHEVQPIIQPQVVEYHVGGPFTQTSVAFLPGYFTS